MISGHHFFFKNHNIQLTRPQMKKHTDKSHSLLADISSRLKRIKENSFTGIRNNVSSKRIIEKVSARLDRWIEEGRHHEQDISKDKILDELGLTGEELSFYCSRVLKKPFLTWRKDLRIREAKVLLLKHPEAPVCHIGYAVGFSDKSNFRQQFKNAVGCTPTEWRERNLDNH